VSCGVYFPPIKKISKIYARALACKGRFTGMTTPFIVVPSHGFEEENRLIGHRQPWSSDDETDRLITSRGPRLLGRKGGSP
jgi:hypothetical protein